MPAYNVTKKLQVRLVELTLKLAQFSIQLTQ